MGHKVPRGSWLIIHIQGIHHQASQGGLGRGARGVRQACNCARMRACLTRRLRCKHVPPNWNGAASLCPLLLLQYQEPLAFKPERYMPGGEYDQFPEDIRPYMVRGRARAAQPLPAPHARSQPPTPPTWKGPLVAPGAIAAAGQPGAARGP